MEKFTQQHINEVEKAMEGIPFGNSAFQIVNFVANEYTESRALRKVLLQMSEKLRALKEAKIRRKKLDIDLREIVFKLKKAKSFSHERLLVDQEEKTMHITIEDKLINDCLAEVEVYYRLFEKLPKLTREEFETQELPYWRTRLQNEARLEIQQMGTVEKGTHDTLNKVGIILGKTAEGGVQFLEKVQPDSLQGEK